MTRTTIAVGRIGPTSRKSGHRRVFVSVAESLTSTDQPEIDATLASLVKASDILVVGTRPERAIAFAEGRGLAVERDRHHEVDLVIAVLDPLMPHGTGNTLPQNALVNARRYHIDSVAVLARPYPKRPTARA